MSVPINDLDFFRFIRLADVIKIFKDKKVVGDNTRSGIYIYTNTTGNVSYVSIELAGYIPFAELKKIMALDNSDKGKKD